MGGKEEVLRPRIRRKQPARPLTRQPAQRTRELSPRSRPLTVLAWRLPKYAPCISISLGRFSRTQGSPGATSALQRSPFDPCFFLPHPCLHKAECKTHLQEGAAGTGAPSVPCPAVPSQPRPAPQTLKIKEMSVIQTKDCASAVPVPGSACFSGVPVRSGPPVAVREPAPPTQAWERPPPRLGSTPRSPPPRSSHFLPRSGLQQNRAARGPKSGKESAFPCRAASSPTLPPQPRPSQSQLQLFPFGLGFPRAAASRRRAARRGAGGRAAARLRVAVLARAASRQVGGWVGGEEGEDERGERRVWRGEGGGDSALLPLPARAGGGGRRPRRGRGGGREKGREGAEEDAPITRAFRKARSTCTFLQPRCEPFTAAAAAPTASSFSSFPRAPGVCMCECV